MTFRLLVLGTVICAVLIASSTLYRVHRGKPILRPEFPELRFTEAWCSGRSNRNVLASILGAPHFLWVAVTEDALHVGPHIPFNLMFLAEVFGWDHQVPGRTILEVREFAQNPRGSRVTIQYRHKTGDLETLELIVTNAADLVSALRAVRGGLD